MMKRRAFIGGALSGVVSAAGVMSGMGVVGGRERGVGLGRVYGAKEDGVKITRVLRFDLACRRPKLIGRNSGRDVHGRISHDPVVMFETNSGVTGFGACRASREQLEKLLGVNPLSLYDAEKHRMGGGLGRQTMPLWDLVGKMKGRPVYELLGGTGGEVRVYDGGIYMSDLLPAYEGRWEERFREELDMSRVLGHTAVKVKIGRGKKWMKREEGDKRDIEVLRLLRAHGGPALTIGVDGNNGYYPARTRKLLEATADLKLAFIEEMFEEDVEEYLALKAFLREKQLDVLIADGETQGEISALEPFMPKKAIDVYQLDMNHMGCEGIMDEAKACKPFGGLVAPHNWGSLLGFFAQLHVGRAVENFYMAEHDVAHHEALVTEGYVVYDGKVQVPEKAGFGLAIDMKVLERTSKLIYELKA